MHLNITFAGKNVGSVKINETVRDLEANAKKGLKKAGLLMERELKKNLKGSNPTTFFYKSPHAELRSRTGRLRASITSILEGLSVRIGPSFMTGKYGAANEYGAQIPVTDRMRRFFHSKGVHLRKETDTITIPPRPWFFPTFEKNKDEIIRVIQNEVCKPLR